MKKSILLRECTAEFERDYLPVPIPCSSAEEIVDLTVVKEEEKEDDDTKYLDFAINTSGFTPEQFTIIKTFPWMAKLIKLSQVDIASTSLDHLEKLMSFCYKNMAVSVNECYKRTNRAVKLKTAMSHTLLFFHMKYSEIRFHFENSSYLKKMSDLTAMYLDMEIKASRSATESLPKVASRITSALYTFFGKSHEYLLDTILKAEMIARNSGDLCDLIFRRVLRDTPSAFDAVSYIRHLLAFKIWKAIVGDPKKRQDIVRLAYHKLKPPPDFREQVTANRALSEHLPKIPSSGITHFFMRAKFASRPKIKEILRSLRDPKLQFTKPVAQPALSLVEFPSIEGTISKSSHLDFGSPLDVFSFSEFTCKEIVRIVKSAGHSNFDVTKRKKHQHECTVDTEEPIKKEETDNNDFHNPVKDEIFDNDLINSSLINNETDPIIRSESPKCIAMDVDTTDQHNFDFSSQANHDTSILKAFDKEFPDYLIPCHSDVTQPTMNMETLDSSGTHHGDGDIDSFTRSTLGMYDFTPPKSIPSGSKGTPTPVASSSLLKDFTEEFSDCPTSIQDGKFNYGNYFLPCNTLPVITNEAGPSRAQIDSLHGSVLEGDTELMDEDVVMETLGRSSLSIYDYHPSHSKDISSVSKENSGPSSSNSSLLKDLVDKFADCAATSMQHGQYNYDNYFISCDRTIQEKVETTPMETSNVSIQEAAIEKVKSPDVITPHKSPEETRMKLKTPAELKFGISVDRESINMTSLDLPNLLSTPSSISHSHKRDTSEKKRKDKKETKDKKDKEDKKGEKEDKKEKKEKEYKKEKKEKEGKKERKDKEGKKEKKDKEDKKEKKTKEGKTEKKDKEHMKEKKDKEHMKEKKDKEHMKEKKDKEHMKEKKDIEHRKEDKVKEHSKEYKVREVIRENEVEEYSSKTNIREDTKENKVAEDATENKVIDDSRENKVIEDARENKVIEDIRGNEVTEDLWENVVTEGTKKNKFAEDMRENKDEEDATEKQNKEVWEGKKEKKEKKERKEKKQKRERKEKKETERPTKKIKLLPDTPIRSSQRLKKNPAKPMIDDLVID